ncbi:MULTISPECIES: hypothetical protein [unclassified Mesobacillus]|uniref:hypothetical protein n=1 Tax=unclassified Mesobacillus TaxID=2675270 RepID=UPI00203B5B7B|nr:MULTISPECIES: hypothetical protein [unclassified Mesobacillus]MCM3126007.1 hypothetical protein [Mesobacillus sp. MER 33]MCM3235993.1 hypothetical protein [Mesobacillus sp. MER 48]
MHYSYDDLVRDIKIGHEIEFKYKGKLYGTINVIEGYGLGEHNKEFEYFKTPEELLNNGKINGEHLKDIWNEVEVITIF